MRILLAWALHAGALMLLPSLINSVKIDDWVTALLAALVIGLLNTVLRPILVLLTLPITLLTLGLFRLVINGFLFWLASTFLAGFDLASLGGTLLAAFAYSLMSTVITTFVLRRNN